MRELPLFEPPIDPELLIRAKAAGLDISDVLAGLYAPAPRYRFQILLQKANEFCGEVRNLGASLLSAIEKQDSERLALLRSSQEGEPGQRSRREHCFPSTIVGQRGEQVPVPATDVGE